MLQFRYGSYWHALGEVTFSSIQRTKIFGPRGQPVVSRVTWQIEGVLLGDDPVDLSARMVQLERAYDKQGQNAGLYFVGGGATAHVLTTADAIGGVRSMGVSYPKGDGAELTTFRSYSVTLEADYPTSASMVEFQETLSFRGTGGPKYIFLPVLNGPPEKQMVLQQTTMQATQSGSAVGNISYPPIPAPLWPSDEKTEERQITRISPQNVLGDKRQFGVQWSYAFESIGPLNGLPNSL